jgi:gliding motility-associated-like protein
MRLILINILLLLAGSTYSQETGYIIRVCEGITQINQYTSSTGISGTYHWYVNGVLQNSNTSTQLVDWSLYPLGTHILSVEFETDDGCLSEPRQLIVTLLECNILYIYVPNAFTPDGDGFNNIWIPIGYNWKEMHYTIYNRWGEVIFESYDGNVGWDGTYGVGKNIPVQDGVYIYNLIVTDNDGIEYVWNGHITVLK